jgi:antitoxin (DNA-binding transcriptional repressor) of toxin-antitoxin stability system
MKTINMHDAKTQLSRLAERVEKGETIVVARAGKPCMDLVPHQARGTSRKPGRLKGRIHIAPDFDQTPDELIDAFEQG